MKKYQVETFCGGDKIVEVAIPTPKEFQCHNDHPDNLFRVLVTNSSSSSKERFAVAVLEPETSEKMRNMGFLFETRAKGYNVVRFEGKGARTTAIRCAAYVLAGGSISLFY